MEIVWWEKDMGEEGNGYVLQMLRMIQCMKIVQGGKEMEKKKKGVSLLGSWIWDFSESWKISQHCDCL